MKKLFRFIFTFVSAILFFAAVSGCSEVNLENQGDNNSGVCCISGKIEGLNSNSRLAMPAEILGNTLTYQVFAYKTSEADKIEGTVTGTSFTISLVYGTWNFYAVGLDSNGKTIVRQDIKDREVRTRTAEDTYDPNVINFTDLQPASGEYGMVQLGVKKASDSSIVKLVAEWEGDSGDGKKTYYQTIAVSETISYFDMTGDDNSFAENASKIPCGAYLLTFYAKNSSGETVYIFKEAVNVYNGFKTNSFINTEMSYVYTDGSILLLKAHELYGSKKEFYVSASGNDNATGGKYSPFKTIQRAVDVIEAVNDGSSTYTITLLSDIYAQEGDGHSGNLSKDTIGLSLVVVNPGKNLILLLKSDGSDVFKISAENIDESKRNFRGFYFGDKAEVSLEKVEICNFKNKGLSDNYAPLGGAILSVSGELYVDKCEIYNNYAASAGGGISTVDSKFYLDNSKVYSNECRYGGGINLKQNSTNIDGVIQDSEIYNNKALTTGGGIWNGINKLEIGSTKIYKNTSKGGGGGLYNRKNAIIESGTKIYENTASLKNGGGICINQGTVTINAADVEIYNNSAGTDNSSAGFGGGVAVFSDNDDSTLEISAGSIYDNTVYSTATDKGLGADVYVADTVDTENSKRKISTLKVSGNPELNNLYLGKVDFEGVTYQSKIDITAAVTYSGSQKGAVISLPLNEDGTYTEDSVLLSSTVTGIVSSAGSFFAVENDGNGDEYHIDSDGKLKKGSGIVVYTDWRALCEAVANIPIGTTTETVFYLKGTMVANDKLTVENGPVKLVSADGAAVTIKRDASYDSAVIYLNGNDLTIEGTAAGKFELDGNSVSNSDSFINVSSGNLDLSYVYIHNCICSGDGAAIYESNSDSVLNISNCEFKSNISNYGGAINAEKGELTVTSSIFEMNTSSSDGGAIYSAGDKLELNGVTMSENKHNGTIEDVYRSVNNNTKTTEIKGQNSISKFYFSYNASSIAVVDVSDLSASSIGLYVNNLQTTKAIISATANLSDKIKYFSLLNDDYVLTDEGKLAKIIYPAAVSTLNGTVPSSGTKLSVATTSDIEQISTWVTAGNKLEGVEFILSAPVALTSSFTPIGNSSTPFCGTFDGNLKTISGLDINSGLLTTYKGLFGNIENSTIKNVRLSGTISCGGYSSMIGAIAGYASGTVILDNCITSVSVIVSSGNQIGGLIGCLYGDATIINCVNEGSVSGDSKVGGIVGYATGTGTSLNIYNCGNQGNISGDADSGGLVGCSEVTTNMMNCFTSGVINANASICGTISTDNSGTVQYCYAIQSAKSFYEYCGGVIYSTFKEFNWNNSSCKLIESTTVEGTSFSADSLLRDVLNTWCQKQANKTDYYSWTNSSSGVSLSTNKIQ